MLNVSLEGCLNNGGHFSSRTLSLGDTKKEGCVGRGVWPRITPRSLRLTCAIHSAVQCRRQLWATAQLWETLPVDPRSSGLQTQRIARCNCAEYSDKVPRHWVVIAYVCICTFYIYVDCNCILYLRVCMPDISRYGMCIKTTSTFCGERVRQWSMAIEDRRASTLLLNLDLGILRESTI